MTLGAIKAHEEGIVTACSVVANGRAFEHAVEMLKDRPGLDVGVHLTLVGERPLTHSLPLLPDFRAFTLRYLLGGIAAAEVEEELRRQIERLLGAGLRVVHANSHQHLHVLPRVFEVVVRLAEEYGIPFIRIPHERAPLRSLRSLQLAVLDGLGRWARPRVRSSDRTIGIFDAGRLTVERIVRLLDDVVGTEGVTELVCHPGLGDGDLAARYPWGYHWDRETAALCDGRVREELRKRGILLTRI